MTFFKIVQTLKISVFGSGSVRVRIMEDLLGQDQDLGVGRNINKASSYSEDYSKLEELK